MVIGDINIIFVVQEQVSTAARKLYIPLHRLPATLSLSSYTINTQNVVIIVARWLYGNP